jgi:ribose transport system permease protein
MSANIKTMQSAPPSGLAAAARRMLAFFGKSPAWPLLVGLIIVFAIGSPRFLTPLNISSVLNQAVLIGVLGIGLTPLVISGNIDLSVGSIAGFGACLLVYLEGTPIGFVFAIALAIIACTAIGLANGIVVEGLGLNSIIVTLAVGTGLRGLTFLVFGTQTVLAPDATLLNISGVKLLGLDISVSVFFVVGILFALMLRFTVHGVNTFAIGGNRRAALDAGVNVTRSVLANFALSGAMAGLVGLIMVAQLGAASPVYGKDYELWATIAVVLGGTALAGGRGTILGTVLADLSLTVLRNGLNLMKIEVRYVLIIFGVVLIAALILDRLRSKEPEVAE